MPIPPKHVPRRARLIQVAQGLGKGAPTNFKHDAESAPSVNEGGSSDASEPLPIESQDSETPDAVGKRIWEVEPREVAGARTGAKFEFQYHQAALDSLQVLDDKKVACLYCEWHDDYAIEAAEEERYRFHQVKTKSGGPWTIHGFFLKGAPSAKSRALEVESDTEDSGDGSIFLKMFDLVRKFGNRCEAFVFVTDNEISKDLLAFRDAAQGATSAAAMDSKIYSKIKYLQQQFVVKHPDITVDAIFEFLRKLDFKEAVGSERNLKAVRLELADRIYEFSEVDLPFSETRKIAENLVSIVRTKSHEVMKMVPLDLEALRKAKGIRIEDILRLLCLSPEGYLELKDGGRESVVALSRLQRYCIVNGIPDELIPMCCNCKSSWDEWHLRQKYIMNPLDLALLTQECKDLLLHHQSGNFGINALIEESRKLTLKFESRITASEKLMDQHVMGLILTLAVGAAS